MHSYVHKYIYQYWDQSLANSVCFLFSHPISSYLVLISYFPCICAKFSHQTIDNDVDLIDRSFGFTTSVEAAQTAILSAKTEARCNLPNGIGNHDNSTEKKSDMRSEKWHLLKELISSSGHLPSIKFVLSLFLLYFNTFILHFASHFSSVGPVSFMLLLYSCFLVLN